MDYMSLPLVSIPESDCKRLDHVVRQAAADRHPVAAFLACELLRANILSAHEFPADTVALDEWVTFRADRGRLPESRLLVCPQDHRSDAIHLSVLSPVGAALIGLRVGSRIPYRSAEGVTHVASVEGIDTPAFPRAGWRSVDRRAGEVSCAPMRACQQSE